MLDVPPRGQLAHVDDRLAGSGERREHALGLGSEGAAGLGEDDAAAGPREERDAELPIRECAPAPRATAAPGRETGRRG